MTARRNALPCDMLRVCSMLSAACVQAMFAARVISDIAGRVSPKTAWIQTQPGARRSVWPLRMRYNEEKQLPLHGAACSNVLVSRDDKALRA